MIQFVRLVSLTFLVVAGNLAHAAESAATIQPRAWYQDLMAHSPEKLTGNYPHRMIVIKKLKAKELPDFVVFPPEAEGDTKGPFLSLVSDAQLNLFLTSNGISSQVLATQKRSAKQERDFWFKFLLNPVLADTLIVMKKDSEAKWDVIKMHSDGQNLKTVIKLKPPTAANLTHTAYINWLTTELGYSGVVIDVRGDLALVGMYEPPSGSGVKLQALALKNSAKRFTMKKIDQKGASILQSKALDGPLGVFEIMLSEEGSHIVPGTKIVLQKGQEKPAEPSDIEP